MGSIHFPRVPRAYLAGLYPEGQGDGLQLHRDLYLLERPGEDPGEFDFSGNHWARNLCPLILNTAISFLFELAVWGLVFNRVVEVIQLASKPRNRYVFIRFAGYALFCRCIRYTLDTELSAVISGGTENREPLKIDFRPGLRCLRSPVLWGKDEKKSRRRVTSERSVGE